MSEEIYNILLKNYRTEIMIMFDTYDDLMTVAEVCVILRISASRVYRLLNTGELNGFHCSRAWRIRKSDLIRYVESNCEHNK